MPHPLPEVIEAFREWRIVVATMIQATDFTIREKPRSDADDTPKDILNPTALASAVAMIAKHTGFGRQEIKWHIFLPEAMEYFKGALRWYGVWTVPVGREIDNEDFSDLAPDWLKDERT